jgi:hypothetical protein
MSYLKNKCFAAVQAAKILEVAGDELHRRKSVLRGGNISHPAEAQDKE